MKNWKLTFVVSLMMLLMAGCGIKQMVKKYPDVSIALENKELENKGGKVEYTVKGTVPAKYLKKKAGVKVEAPYLMYENEAGEMVTQKMGTIMLVGEKSQQQGIKVPYKTGGTFSQSGSFDFNEAFLNAEIAAVSTISMGKQEQTMEARRLGEGISNTSSNIALNPAITETDHDGKMNTPGTFLINAPHQYQEEFITKTGIIYFDVNQYDLNWNLKLNKGEEAKTAIKDLTGLLNEDRVIDRIIITGWASPEGEESRNQGLSEKRFEQGKKWFNQQYDKYLKDYAKKNKIKMKDIQKPELVFENHANGEDWSGFEKAVEQSIIKEKNHILNVVRSQSSSEAREQKIREMTDVYDEIKDLILPPLRRAEIALVCNKNLYNDEQIARLVDENPASLSLNERLYAVTLTDDMAKKEAIYKAIIADEATQTDWRSYNNLAVIILNGYLKEKNSASLEEATNYLNKANATSPNNGIILNNLAITQFLQGDIKTARTTFEESQKAVVYPISQNYNLGMYKILDGEYAEAQKMMSGAGCNYNTALAQLVSKDYAGAQKTLNCLTDKDARANYLQAVLAARLQNPQELFVSLRQAIEQDASLTVKAKKDPEFKKYRQDTEFKNIVK